MGLWYHTAAASLDRPSAERRGGIPAVLMIPEPNDVEQSVRRIRRGCLFMAVTVVALAVLFTSATGNLFYLTLLVVALFMVIFSRLAR